MKQFDEEYKAYVRENAPDLWDRIEAGVDAKISAFSVSSFFTAILSLNMPRCLPCNSSALSLSCIFISIVPSLYCLIDCIAFLIWSGNIAKSAICILTTPFSSVTSVTISVIFALARLFISLNVCSAVISVFLDLSSIF